jgi:glucose/arabinose dehydrogenase
MFSCFAQGQAIDTLRLANGMSRPIYVTHAPGDAERLFIIEKRGNIRVYSITDGELRSTSFLNIDSITGGGTSTNSEQGCLGMAFHPDYQDNGYFYVYYTNNSGNVVVSRYTVSSNPEVANASSASTVITINQPYSNHNGGQILFGPDGYLWIFTGDGGGANDTQQYAQDITNQKCGKILRLDVTNVNSGYAIPADNPYVGTTGDDEIWASGLRNPWRASFDRETGDLYIADVGQNAREEVNIVSSTAAGLNYGWRCMEAASCTGLSGCTCNSSSLTDPVYYYNQSSTYGYCITGGYVYRGCAMPELSGTYFFADYSTTNMFSIKYNGAGGYTNFAQRNELESSQGGYGVDNISSFGEDLDGELYVLDQSGGELFKIIPQGGDGGPCDPPAVCDGDVNGDDMVDGTDLSIVLGFWGACSGCDADVNGDGQVDGTDLSVVLGYWGNQCD